MVALLDAPFYGPSSPFFSGSTASTSLVPNTFHVALNGRPYMVDLNQPFYRQYRRQLAQLIRTQADTSKNPGEQTLDPNSLWRRSFEDWTDGASQRYLDRDTSVPNGFWQSKGIDCLTAKWQISLLPDTTKQRTSGNTNLQVVAANGYVYIADGQTLLFTNSLSGSVTWTTVTGTPADTLSSLCTDGYTVYAAYGAGGIYTTTAGSASATQYVTAAVGATAVIGYVNGRLMLGNSGTGGDGKLYNIVAGGALPTALLAPNNANATWVGFAEGNNNLYGAVNIGLNSYIYGTATTTDGVSLTAPTIQAKLPLGEKVTAILGYLGQLIVGSSQGVRFCQTATTGGISIGSLITGTLTNSYGPTQSVQALAGWGRWVYFGWTNYDTASTGLGRMDLSNFVVSGALPAFASDLMATAQGAVTGVASLAGVQVFAVSGQGFYVQSTNLVASGTISSGYILYDLADKKIPVLLDVETPGPLTYGSYSAAVSADGAAFAAVGQHLPGQTEPVTFGISGIPAATRFEVQLTLNRDGTTTTQGPTITRFTLRAYAAPRRPLTWQLPLILDESITNRSGGSQGFDPLVELMALEAMASAGQMVKYQEGEYSFPVFVQDVQFLPDYTTEENVDSYFNGIALVTLVGLPAQV